MDVTSLLNAGSVARMEANAEESKDSPEQTPTPSIASGSTETTTVIQTPSPEGTPPRHNSGEFRLSIRSRTPWDAGGYSLPLTLDTKSIQAPLATRASTFELVSESPAETHNSLLSASPLSPRQHKCSDSRSSFSSYASSTSSANSFAHSRISSLSTVSEFQPLSAITSDIPHFLDARIADLAPSAISCQMPVLGEVQPPSPAPARIAHELGTSPIGAISHAQDNSARTRSPSDAILIGRLGPSSEANRSESGSLFLSPNASGSRPQHKRALSAPTIPPISEIPLLEDSKNLPLNGMSEPKPNQEESPLVLPSKETPSRSSPLTSVIAEEDEEEDAKPLCMYVQDCNTNSTLRKAVSHIFGRNKLCTRSIPDAWWVHYCRKHYQRSRYRNGQEYSKLQVQLVRQQVQLIQQWSDKNARKGKGELVKDWSLDLRQREKLREKETPKKGLKRRFDQQDADDEDVDVFEKHGEYGMSGGSMVPQWLREKVRTGYSTQEIEEIVEQIQTEMDRGSINAIPDIEILPNIIKPDDSEDRTGRSTVKRGLSATRSHRRSQSLQVGSTLREGSVGVFGRPGMTPDYPHLHPVEKRQRVGEIEDVYGEPAPLGSYRRTSTARSLSIGDVAYGQSRIQDAFYHPRDHAVPSSYSSFGASSAFGRVLPAPTATRPSFSGPGMAQTLESVSTMASFTPGRPGHQRSYSELPASGQYQSHGYPSAMPSAYPGTAPSSYAPFVAPTYQPSSQGSYPPSATFSGAPSPYTSTEASSHSAYPSSYSRSGEPTPNYFAADYPPPPNMVPSNGPVPSFQMPSYATANGSAPPRMHTRVQSLSSIPRLSTTLPSGLPSGLPESASGYGGSVGTGGYGSATTTPNYEADATPYQDFHNRGVSGGGVYGHARHQSAQLPYRGEGEQGYVARQ